MTFAARSPDPKNPPFYLDLPAKDGLRTASAELHRVLDSYGIANNFELYRGRHTSAVADRFQNHVLPYFSRNLSFDGDH